jgi:hypothetical protein
MHVLELRVVQRILHLGGVAPGRGFLAPRDDSKLRHFRKGAQLVRAEPHAALAGSAGNRNLCSGVFA